MSEVWCVIGGTDGRAQALATSLIGQGHDVAIPSDDVAPLAMLVNLHHDAVLPVEIADYDRSSLVAAVDAIEESYGAIDTLAIILDLQSGARVASAARAIARLRPGTSVVLVTGTVDSDLSQRSTQRMLNTVFESRIRKYARAEHGNPSSVTVVEFSDMVASLGLTA